MSHLLSNKHPKDDNVEEPHQNNNLEDPAQKVINLVHGFGYPIEVFPNIVTEDKYLVTLYRIPHGTSNKQNGNQTRPVVLIMHGFLASAIDYLLMGPKRGLAYILAEGGYDVWMGNYRGSEHARKHTKLDASVDKEYWNFSFHEIGVYDIPAMINSIKEITGCEKLSYIGTSQGTASMFVLLSEKPQYNRILKIFICLAPIHCLSNLPSPFLHCLAVNPYIWKPLAVYLGLFTFPTEIMIKFIRYLANNFCHPKSVILNMMVHSMFAVFGSSDNQFDRNELPLIVNNVLNATSVKHYVHFSQNAVAGKFRQFDYGLEENLKVYKQETPPVYDLRKAMCPVAAFHSDGDAISGRKDFDILKHQLPNLVLDHLVEAPTFNHMDFSFAVDVANLLYIPVQKILDKYSKMY